MPATLPELNESSALFLDFDGTVVDLAATPDSIVVPKDLPALLASLNIRLGGALALVSGRPAAVIDRMTRGVAAHVIGVHGAETRIGSKPIEAVQIDFNRGGLAVALDNMVDDLPGVFLERKGSAMAVHYRRAPRAEPILRRRIKPIVAELPALGLEILDGDKVIEIRPKGCNKGAAVRRLMAMTPFHGRVPIFVGDDVTDEEGFEAVLELGGAAVIVGERRSKRASFRLTNPAEVRAWLARS